MTIRFSLRFDPKTTSTIQINVKNRGPSAIYNIRYHILCSFCSQQKAQGGVLELRKTSPTTTFHQNFIVIQVRLLNPGVETHVMRRLNFSQVWQWEMYNNVTIAQGTDLIFISSFALARLLKSSNLLNQVWYQKVPKKQIETNFKRKTISTENWEWNDFKSYSDRSSCTLLIYMLYDPTTVRARISCPHQQFGGNPWTDRNCTWPLPRYWSVIFLSLKKIRRPFWRITSCEVRR